MKKSLSIEHFINALQHKAPNTSYFEIMESFEVTRDSLDPFLHWSDKKYTRNCIIRTKEFELLAICYEDGQATPIHDFDFHEAWIHPIEGRLKEERFRRSLKLNATEKVSSVTMPNGAFTYMDEIAILRYSNVNRGRSISLNLYTPPVEQWRVYSEDSLTSTLVPLSYDSAYGYTFPEGANQLKKS